MYSGGGSPWLYWAGGLDVLSTAGISFQGCLITLKPQADWGHFLMGKDMETASLYPMSVLLFHIMDTKWHEINSHFIASAAVRWGM